MQYVKIFAILSRKRYKTRISMSLNILCQICSKHNSWNYVNWGTCWVWMELSSLKNSPVFLAHPVCIYCDQLKLLVFSKSTANCATNRWQLEVVEFEHLCIGFSWSSEKSCKMKKKCQACRSPEISSWFWKSPDFWSVWSWKINLASMLVAMHLLVSHNNLCK